jgi:hypothetical protein
MSSFGAGGETSIPFMDSANWVGWIFIGKVSLSLRTKPNSKVIKNQMIFVSCRGEVTFFY